MALSKCLIVSLFLTVPTDGIYINEVLEGPCTLSNMFYYSTSDKMVSAVCDTDIDGDCSLNIYVTINSVDYYDREDSRNTTLCGSDKLDKTYIRAEDIENELSSSNVAIQSSDDIEINFQIDSTSTNSLSFNSDQSVVVSQNIESSGNILIEVKNQSVFSKLTLNSLTFRDGWNCTV